MQVFTPDGACMLVAADNPVGIEPYMQVGHEVAFEFACSCDCLKGSSRQWQC